MHRFSIVLLAVFFFFLSFVSISVAQSPKEVKVLAVGNSFSENATTYLPQIVAGAPEPCKLILAKATIGGCDFSRHFRHAETHETDPGNPEGKPYKKGTQSLKEMLQADKWDFVTIQQASPKSFRPETYRPDAKRLYDYIKKYAPQAEVVIHQTWAYRGDEPRFGTAFCASQQEMYRGLCDAYAGIAEELGCRLIRGGDAMELARRSPEWGDVPECLKFDRKTTVYPTLPNQSRSLNNGYSWKKDKEEWKLHYDGTHANVAGNYLLGCVWFEFFFGVSAVDNSFVPDKLDAKDAAILRRIAHEIGSFKFGLVGEKTPREASLK